MVQFSMRDVHSARLDRVKRRRFEYLVRRALWTLPESIQGLLDNIAIVVEDKPRPDQLEASEEPEILFGHYEGRPLTERGSDYNMVLPDVITIFRRPLTEAFPDSAELTRQVQITVIHEIAHHFGINEDRLDELGWQ
jgi:predicted Zn-dependent protease with MMP-like domain